SRSRAVCPAGRRARRVGLRGPRRDLRRTRSPQPDRLGATRRAGQGRRLAARPDRGPGDRPGTRRAGRHHPPGAGRVHHEPRPPHQIPSLMSAPTVPADWSALVSPLLVAMEERPQATALVGLSGSAKGLVISALAKRLAERKISVLMVTPTDEDAERLHADVTFFHRLQGAVPDDILLFPDWGVLPDASTPPVEVVGQRMRVLDRLLEADRGLTLIAPVAAFLQRLLPRRLFAEACFSLKPAATIERADLVTRLLQVGYHQVSVVENPGEYAVRGGIVDLYSTAHEEPRRLDFLGNTIETIRLFDPATQKSSGRAPFLRDPHPSRNAAGPRPGRDRRPEPRPGGSTEGALPGTRFAGGAAGRPVGDDARRACAVRPGAGRAVRRALGVARPGGWSGPAPALDHRGRRAVRQRRAAQSPVALQERRVPQIPRRGEGRRLRRARPARDRPLPGAPSPRGPGLRERLPDRRVCRRGRGLCSPGSAEPHPALLAIRRPYPQAQPPGRDGLEPHEGPRAREHRGDGEGSDRRPCDAA